MIINLHCNGKNIYKAKYSDIEVALTVLKNEEADISLDIDPEPQKGPCGIQVQGENGYFLPVILDADGELREYVNLEGEGKEPVEIGGYDYDAMMVTQDYDLIVRMVKEFYETGDVSRELLK